MAEIVMIGGGIVGTCAGMLFAREGHRVTILERDPAPPPSPDTAWSKWERRGVNQFRQLHYFLPRFARIAEVELPGLLDSLEGAGGLRSNVIVDTPDEMTGGPQSGDERFENVTARRPVAESVVAAMANQVDGLVIERGVAVTGLITEARPNGIMAVTGVMTDQGERRADLVIDSGGRRSSVADWLRGAGSPGPREEIEDSGFIYYGRHFRSADGSVPPSFGPLAQPYGSISTLTLPADNGTWGVGIIASAKDAPMRAVTNNETWESVVRSLPLVAHWIDAEAITDVDVMSKIEDRQRFYVVDGQPVATGLIPLADAWAATNPSLGRGMSIGLIQSVALRDLLREGHDVTSAEFAVAAHEASVTQAGPWVEDTLTFDRHRLAQIEAVIEGRPYETDDPGWLMGEALGAAAPTDPELLRGFIEIVGLLSRGIDVMGRPGVAEKAIANASPDPLPGPDRQQLLAILNV